VTVTVASLVSEFPEFARATVAMIQAKIDEAELRTPERIWGAKVDLGVKYLAAHLLAMSPFGRELKLANDDGRTIYGDERTRLERIVSSGFRVTGVTS
jgi:hypothetical protein